MKRRCRSVVPIHDDAADREDSEWPTQKNASPIYFGRAALEVWGAMPRDVQEVLFETAMKGRDAEREEFARLLHDRHPASG
jgi:hypothetical protein